MLIVSASDHRARPSRTQRTECQASTRRTETKYQRVVCLVLSSLAFSVFARSLSISLSPSPDKSETEVVGIAKSPYRVHQAWELSDLFGRVSEATPPFSRRASWPPRRPRSLERLRPVPYEPCVAHWGDTRINRFPHHPWGTIIDAFFLSVVSLVGLFHCAA